MASKLSKARIDANKKQANEHKDCNTLIGDQ